VEKCIGGGRLTSSHGPQHFESNNWQGKGCRSVCRITINIAWPEENPFFGSVDRNTPKMQCDEKSSLAEVDTSKKRNLMLVGGHEDNAVDLCGEDNADVKRQCLGKGQTMLTKSPRESLDDDLHPRYLLPWDIEFTIDEPVDEPEEEPEV
jgi:hypothetical protein